MREGGGDVRLPEVHIGRESSQRLAEYASAVRLSDGRRNDQRAILHAFETACGDSFARLLVRITDTLRRRPYCVVVSGLTFDSTDQLLFTTISAALGCIGEPCHHRDAPLVRQLTPVPANTEGGNVAPGAFRAVESLHTDGTGWPTPNAYTCLLCVREDQHGGGRSRVLDVESVLEELRRSAGTALAVLQEPVPWQQAGELGGGVHWAPVFECGLMRWLPLSLELVRQADVALPTRVSRALDEVATIIEQCERVLDFHLKADQLLIVANRRCLHARTEIPCPATSERVLLRTRVWASRTPQ
jgi:hypothetical protein